MRTFNLTRPNDGPLRSFEFPDGQPHVAISTPQLDLGGGVSDAIIVTRICSADDLLRVLLAKDTLGRMKIKNVHLKVLYLMGARMDRPMTPETKGPFTEYHPFTLKVIAGILNGAGFASIALYDPHSDVAAALLDAEVLLPEMEVRKAMFSAGPTENIVMIAPDAGASKKVSGFAASAGVPMVQCLKKRDVATGKLSGFQLVNPEQVDGKIALVVDDICDGGGTFAGIGELLKQAGATKVCLYVTHGIFSKGFDIPNVDQIFTTHSYRDFGLGVPPHVTVLESYAI